MTTTGSLIAERYRFGPELGQGGMGTIFRAQDELLDRPVAVKVLNRAGLGTAGRSRLLAEARSAARLNHPNIVNVYDAGEADGLSFIVMELVEGETLATMGRLALPEIVAIVRQICAALAHAHQHGVIHRDLKPENVLVTADGTAKLTDFGLARSAATRLTADGAIVGTVFYLAPEILLGREIDARADLYALGVMLYELTTGRLPFAGDDPVTVISQHLYAAPVQPRAQRPDIPPTLEAVTLSLLAKDPDDRPASAAEVGRRLEHWDAAAEADEAALPLLDRMVRGRMVGRERELAEVGGLWRRALAGAGQALLVSGEPGIGKTRLVRELSALAEVSGAVVLRGECYAEGGSPNAPIAQIVEAAYTAGLLGAASGIALPEPLLADLLSLAPELAEGSAARPPLPDARAQQQRQFEAIAGFLHRLTATRPALVVLEDAHWADSSTLSALRHIARRAQNARLLIVVTYRETELDQACCLPDFLHDLQRERLATRVKLNRLSRDQVRSLLAVMFGLAEPEINAELLDGLYRETEGNPFFLEEVCKALVEDGQIYFDDGAWQRAKAQALQIPQSVRITIQVRLGKLPEPAQEVLRLAAVLGRDFDFDTLQTAAGVAEPALIEALESATRAQIVNELRNGHGLQFTFAHALIPSTLRESMSGPRLRLLHRRVVAAIEQHRPNDLEALAYHTSQAGDDTRALAYLRRAGERALSVYANQEAERHFRSALELCALDDTLDASVRAPLLAGLGEALYRHSRFTDARLAWREAVEAFHQVGDADRAAAAVARQARAAWYENDATGALQICLDGLARIAPEPATPGLAALLHETGRACLFNAKDMNQPPVEAGDYCRRGLALAERFGLIEIQAECLTTLALTLGQGTAEAQVLLKQAIDLTEPIGLYSAASRAYFNLAGGELDMGHDVRAGIAHMRHAGELYRRTGQHIQALDVAVLVADYTLTLGDFGDVDQTLREIRREAQALPQAEYLDLAAQTLEADLLGYRGEWERALERLSEIHERSPLHANRSPYLKTQRLHLSRAIAKMELGERSTAIQEFEAVLADESPDSHDRVAPLCLLALLRSGTGEFEAAERHLAEARRSAGDRPKLLAPLFLHWATGELHFRRGQRDDALRHYEEALSTTQQFPVHWLEARLREEYATVLLARANPGDRERAAAQLAQAQRMFEALKAPRYAARVQARRAALG